MVTKTSHKQIGDKKSGGSKVFPVSFFLTIHLPLCMTAIIFQLPWPPSANTYWRRNGARYFISLKGQEYRKAVISKCFVYCNYFTKDHKLKISLDCYPPDKRRRDLDNLGKAVLDSLQHASVYPDDSQIVELTFRRMPKYGGYLDITLESVDTCT